MSGVRPEIEVGLLTGALTGPTRSAWQWRLSQKACAWMLSAAMRWTALSCTSLPSWNKKSQFSIRTLLILYYRLHGKSANRSCGGWYEQLAWGKARFHR